ncbi:hypothetical protein [uncultured Alistipes sp.]|uniref:hypothetical protein n=1 Tax=uncultured Alistipes sp. TaxID=538949 RepID=UPI002632F5EA|nr:hypothetical protein [uncultured Alistipes sp.]
MSKASFNEAMTRAGFDSEVKISKANLAACLVALKDGHPNKSAVEIAITNAGFSDNDKISKAGLLAVINALKSGYLESDILTAVNDSIVTAGFDNSEKVSKSNLAKVLNNLCDLIYPTLVSTTEDWDGSTYWNGACGANYYYVDYKKVRDKYTWSNNVVTYGEYKNGEQRSRRINGQCGWVRSTVVVSDWTNTGALCNAAGINGGYNCDGTYKVQYYKQKRVLEDRYPDGTGGTNNRTEYRVGPIASRQQVDGVCGYVAPIQFITIGTSGSIIKTTIQRE